MPTPATQPETSPVQTSSRTLVLRAENLEKRYESGRPILRGVSLQLAEGEAVALMGPSGSGKTTLLNCLAGLDRPDQGTITIGNEVLSDLDDEARAGLRRRSIGIIFQFFHLLPTLTARENIEMPLLLLKRPQQERMARTEELLERVSLNHRAHALPSQLSGGEMQRVAIARALAAKPPLLLADEPTGNLDSKTGESILQLIAEVTRENQVGLLMVTHDAHSAGICSRTVHLLDGAIADSPA